MNSILLIKIEIIVFLLSFSYIIYYILDKIKNTYFKVKNIIKPDTKEKKIKKIKLVLNKTINKKSKINKNRKIITEEEKTKLRELLKRIKINTAKGYFDTSKSLIIEGLTIDKFNRELNLELASIYEFEENYKNAEYIYRDMLLSLGNKFIILEKIASVLLKQGERKKSIKFYKKALKKKSSDSKIIEALSELTFDIKDYKTCLNYTNLCLRNKPRDPNKLAMKGFCIEKLGDKSLAIVEYTKVLEMQPYNTEIKKRIKKLKKSNI